MTDFIGKVIGSILAFTLLVLTPLCIWTFSEDLQTKRAVLNEVTNLIDRTTDTGVLSEVQLSDFYLGCASHGAIVDVKVKRYIKVTNASSGGTVTTYVVADNVNTYNKGDIIQVEVQAIDYSGVQRIMQTLLHLFTSKLSFSLAGMVR